MPVTLAGGDRISKGSAVTGGNHPVKRYVFVRGGYWESYIPRHLSAFDLEDDRDLGVVSVGNNHPSLSFRCLRR